MKLGTIILAAGDSSRMGGEPKQLLTYKGQTLMRRVTESALSLQQGPVAVVLGASRAQVAAQLDVLPVTLVDNPSWQTGQASSLKTGLAALYITHKDIDTILVLHTDQPLVSVGLLLHMLDVKQTDNKGIVACRYGTQLGVPALFDRRYFDELLQLDGDKGLQWVIVRHRDDLSEVPFEAGSIDLNSKRDVELFQQALAQAQ